MYMFNIKRHYKLIVARIQIKDVHSIVSYQWAINQKYNRRGSGSPCGYGALCDNNI